MPSCGTVVWNNRQETAAKDTKELDDKELDCIELSEQLKDKQEKLSQMEEIERKCSREYIAYEKAKAKAQRAKDARKKDFKKFG